jgi:glutathione S-transferase
VSERPLVLYRCRTPTNVLCPCGAVARRLAKLGLEHRTERVAYRRSGRPEIEELTRQQRVPVLVDGDQVIHDSKRIIQYLEWKYRRDAGREDPQTGDQPAVYNLKRWRHRKKPSS